MAFKEVRKRSGIFRPWSSGLRAIHPKPALERKESTSRRSEIWGQSKTTPNNPSPSLANVYPGVSSQEIPHFGSGPVGRPTSNKIQLNHHHHHHVPSFTSCPSLVNASLSNSVGVGALQANVLHANRWSSKSGKKQRPKRFQCPHCQVSFSNNGQLKGHVRIHTGERPFACDHADCGKTFTRNEELTRHKRIHTGVRPFPCPLCGKKFGRKDHLKKHVKTHQRPPPMQLTGPVGFPHLPGSAMMGAYLPLSELFWPAIF